MTKIGGKYSILVWTVILIYAIVILVFPPPIASGNPIVGVIALAIITVSILFLIKLVYLDRKIEKPALKKRQLKKEMLATRILNFLTVKGKLKPYLPVIGIILILLDLGYNAFITVWFMGAHDLAVLLLGFVLLFYNWIPSSLSWEKDFLLFFSIILFIILVIPLLIVRLVTQNPSGGVNFYAQYLLAPQLVWLLNVIGIKAGLSSTMIGGIPYPDIKYLDIDAHWQDVVISTECAGIYSFSIFTSLFIAYVLLEYSRINLKTLSLILLGFLTSYAANLFRMMTIVVAGYYYGPTTLLSLTHEYAGLLIFAVWLTLFWWFLIKYMRTDRAERERTHEPKNAKVGKGFKDTDDKKGKGKGVSKGKSRPGTDSEKDVDEVKEKVKAKKKM